MSAAKRTADGCTDARAGDAGITPSAKAGILKPMAGAGNGFKPVANLDPAQRILAASCAFKPNNLPGVMGQLQGVAVASPTFPMMLADTHQRPANLTGSASRFGENFGDQATKALNDRFAGRIDRVVQAINNYLAPSGNIVGLVRANQEAAQAAGQPFYDAAMRNAPVKRPPHQSAAGRAWRVLGGDGRLCPRGAHWQKPRQADDVPGTMRRPNRADGDANQAAGCKKCAPVEI